MPRKKRLKCGRIPVRLFLACHQKSNTFKCEQFCCAKPMCACLFMGCTPRPRERRAAVLSSRLSISCSAHSRANAPELERVRARASCFASRSALSKKAIKHCGAAIVSLIISVSRVARFCFAIIQVFRKFQFANDIFKTILSKFASIAFLLLFFNCIELILTQEYN